MDKNRVWTLGIGLVLGIVTVGCSKPAAGPPVAENSATSEEDGHGWWCSEHGVPEEVCVLCNNKLVADFKAKGDWCTEHDRPDSQCFVCHPEKVVEFAAIYEAKYGKQPPKPTDNGA